MFAITYLYSWSTYADTDFFSERYRGWLWFEEERNVPRQIPHNKSDTEASNDEQSADSITPEEAKAELDRISKDLDDAKHIMLARPTASNIKAYMDKESIVWKNIEALQKAWEIASFLYPEYHDLIKDPVNVHAVKLKKEVDEIAQLEIIKLLAKEFDLVLFFKGSCMMSKAFEPVLKNFSQNAGFKVEAVTMDSIKSQNFTTFNMPILTQTLGIKEVPTLVAVSKDGRIAFELVRGFVSLTELEMHSLSAAEYLISKGILQKSPEVRTQKKWPKTLDPQAQRKIKQLKK